MAKQKYTVTALGFVVNGREIPIGETVSLEHKDFIKNKSHLQKAGDASAANPNQATVKIKELTSEVDRLKKRVAELEKELEDSQGSDELHEENARLKAEIKKLESTVKA